MTAVALGLLTALCYGLANYWGPLLTRSLPLAGVLLVGQLTGVAGSVVLVALTGHGTPDLEHLLWGVAAGACNGLAIATLYPAAAAGPMSIVMPLGATGAAVPVTVGLLAGERPPLLQLLGIPLAVVGVVLAAARRRESAGASAAPRTIVLALVSALAYGGFLATFGEASDQDASWAVLTSRLALLTGTLVLVASLRLPVRVPVRRLPAVVLPGALLLAGTVAYGLATREGLVSVVAVLATLAPVVTVGLAVVVLGERLARHQQVGVAVALAGVVLLAAG